MSSRSVFFISLMLVGVVWVPDVIAQRGGTAARGGKATAARPRPAGPPSGMGGMSRPAPRPGYRGGVPQRPTGLQRPSRPQPPKGGLTRPSQKPGAFPSRPSRPTTLPGEIPTQRPRPTKPTRPGASSKPVQRPVNVRPPSGIARPTPRPGTPQRPITLPGQAGDGQGTTRPSRPGTPPDWFGGVQRPARPSKPGKPGKPGGAVTLPGQIGGEWPQRPNRPGSGGAVTLPAIPQRPGKPGRPDRPVTLPGEIGGNRPGRPDRPGKPGKPGRPDWPNRPGRPDWDNRPGRPDWDNRPGRPGWPGGNWPGGSWGGGNRWNGNNFWNINNNNYYFGSNWSGAYYGNWYHGGWGSGFWRGFATGIGTSWGASALYYPRYTYQTWGRLPVTWHAPIYGSWGLSSIAPNWMYAGYTNPYVSTANQQVVVMVPGTGSNAAESVTAYDYSQPIDTSAGPPEPDVADAAQQLFDSARSQFRSGNYGQALVLTDQALLSMPNDPVLHEFRSLVLFALQRYPEATTAAYAVLSAGPGWDWTTLVGLYDSVETYTAQLRRLEAYVRSNSNAAESQFLLGYHYLVQGHQQQAGQRFAKAAQLRPQDTLARRFAEAFADDPAGSPAPLPAPTPEALEDAQRSGPPPAPPEQLYGRWTAVPSEGVVIRLQLNPAGDFTWSVTEGNRTQTIQGQSSYADQVLVLGQEEGPPLAGKVSLDNSGRILAFKPTGAPEAAEGLRFQREAI